MNSEQDLLQDLGRQYGIEVLLEIPASMLDSELVKNLPVEWARSNGLLPVRLELGLGVLTSDPSKIAVMDDLGLLLGAELTPMLAPASEIIKAIERCYFQKTDSAQDLLNNLEQESPGRDVVVSRSDDLLRVADQAPVTQLVNLVLLEALKARASDVHVEPFEKHLRIRYRIDGLLYEQTNPAKHLEASLISRLKVMAKLDIAEKRLPQDGAARVRVGDREVDIRVSTIPVAEGERVVLRLLNRDSALLPLTSLGMPDRILQQFRAVLKEPNGMVLVTGPTGSGKTTTLYAALQELDTKHLNVLTIEDPIEYQLQQIGQIQVKPKIGLTFAQGLRHILRQDPDVVLVGETRDLETAEIAVRASLTGHLVFTTLHTNDATSAVVRLLDMGLPSYLLSSAVKASMAQRLVRKLCPKCREPAVMTAGEAEGLSYKKSGAKVWIPKGCPECLGGYKGRTGIYEFMLVTPEVQEAIRSGASVQAFRQMVLARGVSSMLDDGLDKIFKGETSVSEILRVVGSAAA